MPFEVKFKLDSSDYETWVDETKNRFSQMVETMKNVAEYIQLATVEYVPLDTSALEQSYDYVVVENTNYIAVGVGYDAVDEKSGFHYAEYQYIGRDWRTGRPLNHPKRGQSFYLYEGIYQSEDKLLSLIETDYLSLFLGKNIMSSGVGKNN